MLVTDNIKDIQISNIFSHLFKNCPKNILYITDVNMENLNLEYHINCPKWNYDIKSYNSLNISKLNFYYYIIIALQLSFHITVLQNIISMEYAKGKFDPLMNVLIVFDSVQKVSKHEFRNILNEVFDFGWKMHFFNVKVIYLGDVDLIQVYTYNPFLRQIYDHSQDIYAIKSDQHSLHNFHKYPLRTETITDNVLYVQISINNKKVFTGLNKYLSDAIVKYFNATQIHKILPAKYFMNITYNLMNNLTDVNINARSNNIYKLRNTEYTYPIMRNDMCIIVPKVPGVIVWLRLRNIITFRLMFLFLITISLSVLLWRLQHKLNNSSFTVLDQVFTTIAFISSVSLPLHTIVMKGSEKVLLISWILFSLLIASAFNAIYFRAMIMPIKKNEPNTAKEIAQHGKLNYKIINLAKHCDRLNYILQE